MKRDTMKASHMFRDQVHMVTQWFKSWNECEQTVALYSLFKKVTSTQRHFLLQVLQQSTADCSDINVLEQQANSPGYISALCSEPKESAVSSLLAHLPLLRPGNVDAKAEYLAILPKVLAHSIENTCHIEESRQLLSYTLIHPATTTEERAQLTRWLGHLEEQYQTSLQRTSMYDEQALSYGYEKSSLGHPRPTNGWALHPGQRDSGIGLSGSESGYSNHNVSSQGRAITSSSNLNGGLPGNDHIPLHATASGPPAFNTGNSHNNQGLTKPRSASITPPVGLPSSHVSDWLNAHHEEMVRSSRHNNNNNGTEFHHAPLSPQSSVTSSGSGSDTHGDDIQQSHPSRNRFIEDASGMKDVPCWLKSLRLHKYATLFQQLSYDEMMGLEETWLESQKVTKGARHKIVLSINKLRERQNLLRSMEKEILESGNLKLALTQMKSMLNTPIKAYTPPADKPAAPADKPTGTDSNDNKTVTPPSSPVEGDNIAEGDLPGQLSRVLGKCCTQLLVTTRLEDECFPLYLQLLDKCIAHEAFTEKQKKLMTSWKQQIQKIWHPPIAKYALDKQRRTMYSLGFPHTFPLGSVGQRRPLRGQGQGQMGMPVGQPQWTFGKHPPLVPPQPSPNMAVFRNNSLNTATFPSRPQMFELKHPVTRTQSAPIKSSQFGAALAQRPVSERVATEPEINARLDSLCLSMTEHALADIPDRGSTY